MVLHNIWHRRSSFISSVEIEKSDIREKPSGKVIATYTQDGASAPIKLAEVPLLGSARIGADIVGVSRSNSTSDPSVTYRTTNSKEYELTDHLGNVRAVVSDVKLANSNSTGFDADIVSYSNYYPFGMMLPARHYESAIYRYGYNGKEKDDEVKGSGNHYDYGMRVYDPRLARFLSTDPLKKGIPCYPSINMHQIGLLMPLTLMG